MRANFNGEILNAEFAQQQAGAQPARREFLRPFPYGALQVACFLGIQRTWITATAQFRRQRASREQLAQEGRQTRGIDFGAMHGSAQE
jgi:hypothetical protein